MRLKLILIFLCLCSCKFEPPETTGGATGSINLPIKPVAVVCKEKEYCKDVEGEEYLAMAIYTISPCSLPKFDYSNTIASSNSKLICEHKNKCEGKFDEFLNDEKLIEEISNESVNLLVFIDLNGNEALDDGEPVNCNEGVEFKVKEINQELKVEIKRRHNEEDKKKGPLKSDPSIS